MSGSDKPAVVIDSGSFTCKFGLAGESCPSVIRTAVPKKKRDLLTTNPIKRGEEIDWDGLEKIWLYISHVWLHLDDDVLEHPVLITEHPLNSQHNREKTAKIIFESLGMPSLCLANEAVLSMLSVGRVGGLSLSVGHDATYAVPVAEMVPLNNHTGQLVLGGLDLNEFLLKKLQSRGCLSNTDDDREIARDIKEKMCRVSKKFAHEKSRFSRGKSVVKTYQISEGETIAIGAEETLIPEALFRPSILGRKEPGIVQLAHDTIKTFPGSLRNTMYSNVVLSGGSSLVPGLADRLTWELQRVCPAGVDVKIICEPIRRYASWIGGSILASLPHKTKHWITQEEYQEHGANIVHQKCM